MSGSKEVFLEHGIDLDEDELKHYGVLGMKWGVRNDRRPSASEQTSDWKVKSGPLGRSGVVTKSRSRSSNASQSSESDVKTTAEIHKEARSIATRLIKDLNQSPRFVGRNLNSPRNSGLKATYDSEVKDAVKKAYLEAPAALKLRKTQRRYTALAVVMSASALIVTAAIDPKGVAGVFEDVTKGVKHSEDDLTWTIPVTWDSEGKVSKLEEVKGDEVLVHSSIFSEFGIDLPEDELKHYGVLGMKWGVRKDRRGARRIADSEDHKSSRQLKKNRTRTLSNDQIRQINKRLQLESDLDRLRRDTNGLVRGEKIVKTALGVTTTVSSLYAFSQSPLGKQITGVIKESLTKKN